MPMPQLETLNIAGVNVHLWHLTESEEELSELSVAHQVLAYGLSGVAGNQRRREKLAVALLAHLAMNGAIIQHREDGAPITEGRYVSVSHTFDYVAIAEAQFPVGIDVEHRRGALLKVRSKFVNEAEQPFVDADNLDAHLALWTSKEALFKLHPVADLMNNWTVIGNRAESMEGVKAQLAHHEINSDTLLTVAILD